MVWRRVLLRSSTKIRRGGFLCVILVRVRPGAILFVILASARSLVRVCRPPAMLGPVVTALTSNASATVSATCRGMVGFTIGPSYRCARDPEESSTRRVAGGRHRRLDARVLCAGPQHERAHRVPHRSERAS